MIKKLTDPKTYLLALNDIENLFRGEIEGNLGHVLPVSKKRLAEFADKNLLTWQWHVWANEEVGGVDAICIFSTFDHPLFDKKIATDVLWLSKNPKVGLTILRAALKWFKENGHSHFIMGIVENYPKSTRLKKLYRKMGLTKDGEAFIGCL